MAKQLIESLDNEIIEYFLNVDEEYLIGLKEKKGYDNLKEILRKIPLNKLESMIKQKMSENTVDERPNEKISKLEGEIAVMCEAYSEVIIEKDTEKYDDIIGLQRLIELERRRKEKEREAIMKKSNENITKMGLFDRSRLDRIEKRDEYLEKRQEELDEKIRKSTFQKISSKEIQDEPSIEM